MQNDANAGIETLSDIGSANPVRRRLPGRAAAIVAGVVAGVVLLSLLLTVFSGRLERPFTRVVGRTVDFISDHLRAIAVVSVAAFLAVWLFIGLVALVQWRKDRHTSRGRTENRNVAVRDEARD